MNIYVVPENSEANWFSNNLNRFGKVNFLLDEDNLNEYSNELNQKLELSFHQADLVIYRRKRALKWYPTKSRFLCFEWTQLRNPLIACNYYLDLKGFSTDSTFEQAYYDRNMQYEQNRIEAGKYVLELYRKSVDERYSNLLKYSLTTNNRPILLVILQVPNDDSIIFDSCVKIQENPYEYLINTAISLFKDDYKLIIKPHPVVPNIKQSLIQKFPEINFVNAYIPILPLISISDRIITVNSSSAFEALILGKPVDCLGNTMFSKMGFFGNAHDRNSAILGLAKWSIDEKRILGFLSSEFGCWMPDPTLLIKKVENIFTI